VEAKMMILEEFSVHCSSVLLNCHYYFLDVWDDLLEILALEGMSSDGSYTNFPVNLLIALFMVSCP
jgi:hypothetical protein